MRNIIYKIYTFFKKDKIFKIWRFVLSKFLKDLIYIYKFYMYKVYILSIVKIKKKNFTNITFFNF